MTNRTRECTPADDSFSLISNEKLLALYSAMLRCRSAALNGDGQLYKQSSASHFDSFVGQEAAAVGAAIDLLPRDTVAATQWPQEVLKAINPSVSLVSHIPMASRPASAAQDEPTVSLFFSRSRRASQASWLRALSLGTANNLPVLFVSLHGRKGSALPVAADAIPLRKKGYALPTIAVDGSDVVAVYRVACEAITHARKGNGPTLIECHISHPCDPVQNMQNYLIRKELNPQELF